MSVGVEIGDNPQPHASQGFCLPLSPTIIVEMVTTYPWRGFFPSDAICMTTFLTTYISQQKNTPLQEYRREDTFMCCYSYYYIIFNGYRQIHPLITPQ